MYNKQGESVNLKDFEGDLVYLNFGSWWCPPWRWTIGNTLDVVERYEGQIEFVFVGINGFYHDDLSLAPDDFPDGPGEQLGKYFADLAASTLHSDADINTAALEFFGENTMFDFRGVGQQKYRSYTDQTYGIPATFLIDRDGIVVFDAHNIYQNWDQNIDVLDAFIAGQDLTQYLDRFPVEESIRLD